LLLLYTGQVNDDDDDDDDDNDGENECHIKVQYCFSKGIRFYTKSLRGNDSEKNIIILTI